MSPLFILQWAKSQTSDVKNIMKAYQLSVAGAIWHILPSTMTQINKLEGCLCYKFTIIDNIYTVVSSEY